MEMGAGDRPGRREQDRRQERSTALTKMKNLHDEAFLYIDQGLTCDEQGHRDQAITLYLKGVDSIDKAMSLAEAMNPFELQSVQNMITKMTAAKAQTKTQIDYILSTDSQVVQALEDPPPSYEVATTPTESMEIVYPDSLLCDYIDSQSLLTTNATEIFSIQDGVQIFFITPEGNVSAPSYPSGLGIFSLDEPTQAATNIEMPPAFLKVGNWTYPLIPGQSPVLRADWGAYIFPDVSTDVQGASVGVIIPDFITEDERKSLEEIFHNLTAFRHQESMGEEGPAAKVKPAPPRPAPPRPAPPRPVEPRPAEPADTDERTSTKISRGIVTGAEWIAWGLQKGAEKTGQLLQYGSVKLREQLGPEGQNVKVDPRYSTGAQYARQAAGVACKVSVFLVDAVGKGTMALAKTMAPHVQRHGEKLLPESLKQKNAESGRSKLDDFVEVSVGGLQGFGTVYMGLEKAGTALAKSLANETVTVVKHKYGKDAGKLTENTLYAVGGVGMTAYNASHLGLKALVKRTAKDTARATLAEYHDRQNLARDPQGLVDKTLPPDEIQSPCKQPPP